MSKRIFFRGQSYYFKLDFKFNKMQKIIEDYKGEKPNFKLQWWKKTSKFGEYILDKISENIFRETNITQKEWYKFIPILKEYFITLKDEMRIRHNLYFLMGTNIIPSVDYYFMKYTLLSELKPNDFQINSLPYKEAVILCRYLIGQRMRANEAIMNYQQNTMQTMNDETQKQEGMLV